MLYEGINDEDRPERRFDITSQGAATGNETTPFSGEQPVVDSRDTYERWPQGCQAAGRSDRNPYVFFAKLLLKKRKTFFNKAKNSQNSDLFHWQVGRNLPNS